MSLIVIFDYFIYFNGYYWALDNVKMWNLHTNKQNRAISHTEFYFISSRWDLQENGCLGQGKDLGGTFRELLESEKRGNTKTPLLWWVSWNRKDSSLFADEFMTGMQDSKLHSLVSSQSILPATSLRETYAQRANQGGGLLIIGGLWLTC